MNKGDQYNNNEIITVTVHKGFRTTVVRCCKSTSFETLKAACSPDLDLKDCDLYFNNKKCPDSGIISDVARGQRDLELQALDSRNDNLNLGVSNTDVKESNDFKKLTKVKEDVKNFEKNYLKLEEKVNSLNLNELKITDNVISMIEKMDYSCRYILEETEKCTFMLDELHNEDIRPLRKKEIKNIQALQGKLDKLEEKIKKILREIK